MTGTYNELGHLIKIISRIDQTTDRETSYLYDYDAGYADPGIGRLKEVNIGTSGTNKYTYGYSGVNPLIQSLTRPNGSITEYLYNDPLKRITEITNKDSAQTIINKHVFTYNNLDLIDTETITTGTPIDSFTEGLKTYNYNNINQLLNATNPMETFTYDDDGNMTQGYTLDGYVMAMTYDAEKRLTSAEYTDSGSIVHRTEYFYSGDNLLAEVKKYENGSLVSNIRFVRAEFLPVQERDGSNQVVREYNWGLNYGGGIGGLLNLRNNGDDYSYLYDGKGNVVAVIDSNEQIVASYRYDVFGNLMVKTGALNQPFLFSTKRYDESTGLSYYGYRFYSPIIGRWITRDPLGETGGINLYGFNNNSAVNYIDPEGKAIIAVGICIGAMTLDVASTIYDLNKYAEEMAEIKNEIETAKKTCSSDEEYIDKTMELQRRMLEKSHEIAKRRLEGIAYGIPIAFFCAAAPFLPF